MPKKHEEHKQATDQAQPELNIGIVGHVDHGKTTLVKALSGKWTDIHSEEIKRGITIRLGYADVSIYKEDDKDSPDAYTLKKTTTNTLARKISLVDSPGHESLMATMLCGANIMDGALLLISANEDCPQPQTREHIQALTIIGIKNIIVLQNKIDLADDKQAKKNYDDIKTFLANTPYANAPIIPVSARYNINIDVLLEAIVATFPLPQRDTTHPPQMFVARSFDINKPGTTPEKMLGGVLGGALKQGTLKQGDTIEILPGYESGEKANKTWKPLTTTIIKLVTGGQDVEQVGPGGSIAIQTALDPSIVRSDTLVGAIVGHQKHMPAVWNSIKLTTTLLERVVGAKDELVVDPIKPKEALMLNVNAAATIGTVTNINKKLIDCTLKRPVCADKGSRVTISRIVGQRWRLIGYGTIE